MNARLAIAKLMKGAINKEVGDLNAKLEQIRATGSAKEIEAAEKYTLPIIATLRSLEVFLIEKGAA